MDETLISNWNSEVCKKGTVIIVGDFSFKNHAKYLARLNGKKILIVGNHDKMSQVARAQFTEVHQILCRSIQKKYVVFCHYPMLSWPGSGFGSWQLHGHAHQRLREYEHVLRLDVGVDGFNYKPVPWSTIVKIMAKKELARQAVIKSHKEAREQN